MQYKEIVRKLKHCNTENNSLTSVMAILILYGIMIQYA